jgi:hypothetical protein
MPDRRACQERGAHRMDQRPWRGPFPVTWRGCVPLLSACSLRFASDTCRRAARQRMDGFYNPCRRPIRLAWHALKRQLKRRSRRPAPPRGVAAERVREAGRQAPQGLLKVAANCELTCQLFPVRVPVGKLRNSPPMAAAGRLAQLCVLRSLRPRASRSAQRALDRHANGT